MGWGISENASEKEKKKTEMADFLQGLNSTGIISYEAYSEIFDLSMKILDEMHILAKKEKAVALNFVTKEDSLFVHLASTHKNAVEWVKKYGQDWDEEKYCFLAYEITMDKEDYADSAKDNAYFINLKGETSMDNPLFM